MAKVHALAEKLGARILIGHAPEDFQPIDAKDPVGIPSRP
jgi:hypothetical protein